MKRLVLFLALIFISGCAQNTISFRQQSPNPQKAPTPAASPTPFTFPKLTNIESRSLDEKLPMKTRKILMDAEEIELFDTTFCPKLLSPKMEPIEPNKFLGCGYTKKVVVTDPSLKRQILEGFYYGVSTSSLGAACFAPKYGLRAMSKGKRVELIICFQCENFRGVSTSGNLGGGISKIPKELFEQVFANSEQK